jgi:hypothetical protein
MLALDLVPPPLGQVRTVLAQVELLVQARGGIDDPRQRPRATEAHLREQVHEGVDALGRQQLTIGPAVALLATPSALRLPPPCAGGAASARPGSIARRRQVRVLRVAVQQLRQQLDLLGECGDLRVLLGDPRVAVGQGRFERDDTRVCSLPVAGLVTNHHIRL